MSGVLIEGLRKRFGDVTAVDGVDLHVEEGELVVLLGPSGCGKTSTLRCIAGLESIDDGSISIDRQIVSSRGRSIPPERRPIGMVFQSYAIWPHLTVFENVAFPLRLKRTHDADVARRVATTLELVGLESLARRGVSQLSGGQQQRVAVARAIIAEPRVLLFDEPLSNLDAALRERMRFDLRQLQRRLGTTSVYVTHDQQEAMVIADRVVLMDHGRIVQVGTPVEIYERPANRFAAEFIGLANLLPARVTAVGPYTCLALDGGLELVTTPQAVTTGQAVHVVVRPEYLEVGPGAGSKPNSFAATVTDSFFLGNIADTYLQVGSLSLRAQLSPARIWPKGSELAVHIPPESIVLIPA